MENTRVRLALPAHHVFGGFWIRFAAHMLDWAIIAASVVACWAVIILPLEIIPSILAAGTESAPVVRIVTGIVSVVFMLASAAWMFGYFILFYGKKSTTPGKMLFGMRVVREENGGVVTWGQATGRTFSYLLSRIFYIGFIIAAFDEEKRSLHDLLARTRVIRDTRKPHTIGWVLFGVVMFLYVAAVATVISLFVFTINTVPEFSNDKFDPSEYEMEQLNDFLNN